MRNNIAESILGAIVLIISAGILMFAYSSSRSKVHQGYDLIARFDRIDGILVGNDVRLSGIKIGNIKKLILDPKTYMAVATLTIDDKIKLPSDTLAEIISESLLGNKYMALVPGGNEDILKPGDEITHTQSSVNLESLIGQMIFGKDEKNDSISPG